MEHGQYGGRWILFEIDCPKCVHGSQQSLAKDLRDIKETPTRIAFADTCTPDDVNHQGKGYYGTNTKLATGACLVGPPPSGDILNLIMGCLVSFLSLIIILQLLTAFSSWRNRSGRKGLGCTEGAMVEGGVGKNKVRWHRIGQKRWRPIQPNGVI